MLRITSLTAAALLVSGVLGSASAQTPAPAATAAPATSKMKLTRQSLKDMRAKWSQNKGKLAACRKDVKAKGLAGDDRWFYIEDCMGKT
jgi:hypothetical protein